MVLYYADRPEHLKIFFMYDITRDTLSDMIGIVTIVVDRLLPSLRFLLEKEGKVKFKEPLMWCLGPIQLSEMIAYGRSLELPIDIRNKNIFESFTRVIMIYIKAVITIRRNPTWILTQKKREDMTVIKAVSELPNLIVVEILSKLIPSSYPKSSISRILESLK
jgi:hypothetical protein